MVNWIYRTMNQCKSSFNPETFAGWKKIKMHLSRIISNLISLNPFSSGGAKKTRGKKKILMKLHMEQMESGNMKMMMEKNPEWRKMQSPYADWNDGEKSGNWCKRCNPKMLDKMNGEWKVVRKMLMDESIKTKLMKRRLKGKMMQWMDENRWMKEENDAEMMEKTLKWWTRLKEKIKENKG